MVIAELPYEERWSTDAIEECKDLWNLTAEETDKLVEFKERIEDVEHWKNDPFEVIRFFLQIDESVFFRFLLF